MKSRYRLDYGHLSRFAKGQPWPDYGRGEDIAGAALFLASDDSAFVTGEKLVVDGGLTAAGPELSKKFPRTSARDSKYSGVTRGSTGEAPDLRKLSPAHLDAAVRKFRTGG